MSIALECKKMKRTGFYPAFIVGGVLASCLPVLNMTVRSEVYTGLSQPPVRILLDANWSMMAMLNILLIISGACILYHTEYADNTVQKMHTLPIRESGMLFAKYILMTGMSIAALAIEAITVALCSLHWFEQTSGLYLDLLKNFIYFLILTLPSILLSLFISSACKNMWISLGVGVVCVFIANIIISTDKFILLIFPFALPFQILAGTPADKVMQFLIASVVEIVVIGIAMLSFLRIKRSFT